VQRQRFLDVLNAPARFSDERGHPLNVAEGICRAALAKTWQVSITPKWELCAWRPSNRMTMGVTTPNHVQNSSKSEPRLTAGLFLNQQAFEIWPFVGVQKTTLQHGLTWHYA
jgi:hypothetical protein